ncbi:MAG TPA: hypothetical protein VFE98_04060 [Candidatus Bathyarchaeia archaeon]|nr:hypothetical protein [Candidatus Bathyarchaeia archaeon]
MNLKQTRLLAFTVLGVGMSGGFLLELYLTPKALFTSPFYYVGLTIFSLVGAFPYVSTSPRVSRLTGTAIIVGGLGLIAASRKFPQTLEIAFGAPAILIGIGLRAGHVILTKK